MLTRDGSTAGLEERESRDTQMLCAGLCLRRGTGCRWGMRDLLSLLIGPLALLSWVRPAGMERSRRRDGEERSVEHSGEDEPGQSDGRVFRPLFSGPPLGSGSVVRELAAGGPDSRARVKERIGRKKTRVWRSVHAKKRREEKGLARRKRVTGAQHKAVGACKEGRKEERGGGGSGWEIRQSRCAGAPFTLCLSHLTLCIYRHSTTAASTWAPPCHITRTLPTTCKVRYGNYYHGYCLPTEARVGGGPPTTPNRARIFGWRQAGVDARAGMVPFSLCVSASARGCQQKYYSYIRVSTIVRLCRIDSNTPKLTPCHAVYGACVLVVRARLPTCATVNQTGDQPSDTTHKTLAVFMPMHPPSTVYHQDDTSKPREAEGDGRAKSRVDTASCPLSTSIPGRREPTWEYVLVAVLAIGPDRITGTDLTVLVLTARQARTSTAAYPSQNPRCRGTTPVPGPANTVDRAPPGDGAILGSRERTEQQPGAGDAKDQSARPAGPAMGPRLGDLGSLAV